MRMRFKNVGGGRDEVPAPSYGAGERSINQIAECSYEISARKSEIPLLPFNQSDVSSSRALLGFLDRKVDALAFPKQLEHRAPHGAAMKKVLQARFVTNEAKALVD
jgi:hypothetical protein